MKENLHNIIYKIICEGNEYYEDSEDVTFKVLNKVQEIIGGDIEGYIGNINIITEEL